MLAGGQRGRLQVVEDPQQLRHHLEDVAPKSASVRAGGLWGKIGVGGDER